MNDNKDKNENHCLICGKTISLQKKIKICQNCRNRGKEISLVTGLGIISVAGFIKKKI